MLESSNISGMEKKNIFGNLGTFFTASLKDKNWNVSWNVNCLGVFLVSLVKRMFRNLDICPISGDIVAKNMQLNYILYVPDLREYLQFHWF